MLGSSVNPFVVCSSILSIPFVRQRYPSTSRRVDEDGKTCWGDLRPPEESPPLKYSKMDTSKWEGIGAPALSPYSCRRCLAHCSSPSVRDLILWLLALSNDGLIDITIQETTPVSSLLGKIGAAPNGGQYWAKTVSEQDTPSRSGRP